MTTTALHIPSNEQERYRNHLISWVHRLGYPYVLTLNWNRETTFAVATSQLNRLFREVDRRLFGTRFHVSPIRTSGVFFFEHIHSNLHCHGVVDVPEDRRETFETLFKGDRGPVWSKIVNSGTYLLLENRTPLSAAIYITKSYRPGSPEDTMVVLNRGKGNSQANDN